LSLSILAFTDDDPKKQKEKQPKLNIARNMREQLLIQSNPAAKKPEKVHLLNADIPTRAVR